MNTKVGRPVDRPFIFKERSPVAGSCDYGFNTRVTHGWRPSSVVKFDREMIIPG